MKISEFCLSDQAWDYGSNRRIVLDAISISGIGRCVFATNFPVVGMRIGYNDLVCPVSRMIAHFSRNARGGFFWRNAASFYRINLPGP